MIHVERDGTRSAVELVLVLRRHRDADELVRLHCHPEVGLCDACVAWLGERAGRAGALVRRAIPILATTDIERALRHYRALGFETEQWEGGGYGFLSRDGVELHIGQVTGLHRPMSGISAYLHVADAERLHDEWLASGVDGVLVAPVDMPYGLREGHHVDPDGNLVRFASPIPGDSPVDAAATIPADDPLAVAATAAVQSGDLEILGQLLLEHPDLATARIGDAEMSRTLLHAATDWPGHYPDVARTIGALVDAGADVDARFHGPHEETPLHWAASSDDVEALDAEPRPPVEAVTRALWMACHGGQREAAETLLDRGADIDWIGWDHLTPLDVATRAGATDLASALRECGARTLAQLREPPG